MRDQRGFSFVEIVVAILIMSIISVGLVSFIVDSSSGYVVSAARNQVSSAGRIVLDRISMELRNAVPESVRISAPLTLADQNLGRGFAGDQCIEFIPIKAATTYINPAFRPAAGKFSFTVVDFVPDQTGQTGLYAIIYPTSPADIYTGSFSSAPANTAIARVDVSAGTGSDAATTDTLTYMSTPPMSEPYQHRFTRTSSVERIFLTEQPISYCITGSKLYRYSDYGFVPRSPPDTPPIPEWPNGSCTTPPCLPDATPKRELITDQVDNSALTGSGGQQAFDQIKASRRRNAIIQLELNFVQSGQEVSLNHEVLLQTTQ